MAGVDVIRDPVRARAELAVVPQRSNLDRALTPRQNLEFHAAYHGVGRAERKARAARLLDEFGLADRADDKVDWYSGGMAQRLMIARALTHEPKVLFLDEPTTGLDPQARLFVWDRIRELRDRGVTLVLTTHDMDEAADLADRVGIIDHGKLLALETPSALTKGLSGQSVLELTITRSPNDDPDALVAALAELDGVDRVERVAAAMPGVPSGLPGGFPGASGRAQPDHAGAVPRPNGAPRPRTGGSLPAAVAARLAAAVPAMAPGGPEIRLRLYLAGAPAALLGPVVAALTARSAVLSDVHIGVPSLEDVFIELTGRGLR